MALLRAVIYCRCSTEEESQVDALYNQVTESKSCAEEQGWFLIDQYVESKSGTTTKGRDEYNRLFEDLLTDKFDVIIIKSQDRLMRNVKDWYLFLDRMLSRGKRLYMYIDKKFYTTDDALITGIKAILAEEYSRELSKKINNAHRHRQQSGGKVMLTSRVCGFTKQADGTVSVIEEEAEMIRRIYEYCAAGYGGRTIANILLNEECKKRTGTPFSAGFIGRVIRNPLYKGTLVMNRLHYDFETKRTVKTPKEEWVYGTDLVPAIVSAELWERANTAMTDRAARFHRDKKYRKGSSPGRYDLSGKIICGACGKTYYRVRRRGYSNHDDIVIEWKCSTYLEKGRKEKNRHDSVRIVSKEFDEGCDNVHLDEKILFSLLEQVAEQYYDLKNKDREGIINQAVKILQRVLKEKNTGSELYSLEEKEKKLERQKEILLTKLLEGVISDHDYQKRSGQMEEELSKVQDQKNELKQREGEVKDLENRIEAIKKRLEKGGIEKATVSQMLEDIDKIVVYEWQLEIHFDPLKIMGISDTSLEKGVGAKDFIADNFTVTVNYPFSPLTEHGRYLDKIKIMEIMSNDPHTTAKKIASQMKMPVNIIQNRIKDLRREGKIRFDGRGGHGRWEVKNGVY